MKVSKIENKVSIMSLSHNKSVTKVGEDTSRGGE